MNIQVAALFPKTKQRAGSRSEISAHKCDMQAGLELMITVFSCRG